MPWQCVLALLLMAVCRFSFCSGQYASNYLLDVRLNGDIMVEQNIPRSVNNILVNNLTLPKSCWVKYDGDSIIHALRSGDKRIEYEQIGNAIRWRSDVGEQGGSHLLQYTLPQALRVNQFSFEPRFYDLCWNFIPVYPESTLANNALLAGTITIRLPQGYRMVSKNDGVSLNMWFKYVSLCGVNELTINGSSATWPPSLDRDISVQETNRQTIVFHYTVTLGATLSEAERQHALTSVTAESLAFTLRLFLDNPDLDPQINKPTWQAYEEYSVGLGFIYFAIGIVLPILPLLVFYAERAPEPASHKVLELSHERRTQMLMRLAPAMLGTIVHNRVSRTEVLATILDLSRRDYLVIEQRRSDFIIRLTGDPRTVRNRVPLHTYEQHLLTSLANEETTNGADPSKAGISFKELKHRMRVLVPQFESLVYQSLHHAGYINPPSQVRAKYRVLATLVLCFALISYYVTDLFFRDDIITLPFMFASLLVTAVEFYSIKARCTILTKRGSKYYHHAMLLKKSLEERFSTTRPTSPLYMRAVFDEYLPYTAVLDVDKLWAAQWDKHIHPGAGHYYYPHWFIVPADSSPAPPSFLERYQTLSQQMARSLLKILLK